MDNATTVNPAVAAATTFDDMEKSLKGLKDGSVTEAEAVRTMERLVEGKVEAIRTLTDTMSMQRAIAHMLEAPTNWHQMVLYYAQSTDQKDADMRR